MSKQGAVKPPHLLRNWHDPFEQQAWLQRCYFSHEGYGECTATSGLTGAYQTKWYEPSDSAKSPDDLKLSKNWRHRLRNLCKSCYEANEGSYMNKGGAELPRFIDCSSDERWELANLSPKPPPLIM